MSREMRDFVTAFGMGFSIGDRINQRNRQGKIDQASGADWTNPELADFDARYGGQMRATSGAGRIPEVTSEGKRVGEKFAEGGLVEDDAEARMRQLRQQMPLDGSEVEIINRQVGPPQEPSSFSAAGDWAAEGTREKIRQSRMRRATAGIPHDPPPPVSVDDFPAERAVAEAGQRVAAETGPLPNERGGATPKAKPKFDQVSVEATTHPDVDGTPRARRVSATSGGLPDYESTDIREPSKTGGVPRFGQEEGGASATGSPQVAGAQPATAGDQPANGAQPSAGGGGGVSASGGAAGGAGRATASVSGRKGLKDQTRIAAFNPEDPQDLAEADDVTRQAIMGGLQYATRLFGIHEGDHRGAQAFVSGVGAPDAQTMQAVDQTVAKVVPDDYSGSLGRAKLQMRRMEIMYRWAVQHGNTDRANKLAFEIMQFAAGTAAQYGTQAVQAFRQGNVQAGQQAVVQALDEIPDGYSVTAAPDGSIVYSDSKGRQISQTRMTPEQMFNMAMGLSNRSLYWNVLKERAGLVPAAARAGAAGRQAEMHDMRMTTEGLRQQRLRQTIAKGGASRGGGAVASPVSDALADIRSRMPARGGVPGAKPAPAATGGDGDGDDDGDGDIDGGALDTSMDGPPGTDNAVNDETGRAPRPPASVLRTKPGTPSQAVPPKFDPEGDGYDYETAKAAGLSAGPDGHWPSRDPRTGVLLKGRRHPTFLKGVAEDAKLGYTLSQKDGRYITQPRALPSQASDKSEFDEPHPLAEFGGRDPYADLLAGIDPKTGKQNPAITQYWATRQGRAERSNIIAEQRVLNREVAAWEKRKAKFDKDNAAGKASGSKPRDVAQTDTLSTNAIMTGIKTRMDQTSDENGVSQRNTFNDRVVDDASYPKELHDLTMDIVTSNTNMPTERALDHLGSFLDNGTEENEKDLRAFDVLGWDPSKKFVVLSPRGNPNIKVKITPDGYERLHRLVDKRFQSYQKKKAEPTWGDVAKKFVVHPYKGGVSAPLAERVMKKLDQSVPAR